MKNNFHGKYSLIALTSALLFTSSNAQALSAGTTDTGLDQIIDIINTDTRLNKRVSPEDIAIAATAADAMNRIIVEAIQNTGVANDGKISKADARELNDYIFANYHHNWVIHHGDDENGEETGFHLVQNDGARTKLFGKNAINRVADGIYHLGFETHKRNRLLNEDGNKNVGFSKVATWLDELLANDLPQGHLKNLAITEVEGSTGTGLDQIIDIIYNDEGLNKRISTGDMREGAAAADAMNTIVVDAIRATSIASDGEISIDDARTLNQYIHTHYEHEWIELHGDDENGEETGFHLVQADGAKTRLFEKNAINKVADGIYHLGFPAANKRRLLNEDGNKNASFKNLSLWLNGLLAKDLQNGNLN